VRFFVIFLWLCFAPLYALIDLDEKAQPFVLKTQQIKIPGFDHAFNPGIVRWNDKLLLCFRFIPDAKQTFHSHIGLVWLNDDFSIISTPEILHLQASSHVPERIDDARLIVVAGKLYLVYSNNIDEKVSRGGFRMFIAELRQDVHGKFFAYTSERLSYFSGESQALREKNWVPFDCQGKLLLAYSITPHLIFAPLLDGSEACEMISLSSQNSNAWNWGTLRGGTPAMKIGEDYLSFFHSSVKMASVHSDAKETMHYFMGAYTFSAEPPFALKYISPEPIFGKNFYQGAKYKPYWGSVNVVFPCGFVFNDNYIWVTYGRQDHEVWLVKIDRKGLFASMIPIGE
jgi:predicted GH43/DUF377 family glycosyl hydrolase